MPTKKPLTKAAVRKAAAAWRREPGRGGFRDSIHYDVIIDGKAYPPKAIVGLANELVGNPTLAPSDFVGARDGPWHATLKGLGFEIVPKGDERRVGLASDEDTILRYRDDERFIGCPRAILVTGRPETDAINRRLLAANQSGHWQLSEGRVVAGDALFLLLPSASGKGGYPRELFGGVLNADPILDGVGGRRLLSVASFELLDTISSGLKKFLGDRLPMQGDLAMSVWDEADERKELASSGISSSEDDDDDDDGKYPEGAESFKWHRHRERNQKPVWLAKLRRLRATGKLQCEACDFDFAKAYGPRGHGYIEAHHKKPFASNEGETTVRASDFALVCANCHRMLHRMKPPANVDDLRATLTSMSESRPG